MEIAAFILSVIAGVIGFFFLSEATLGVGILAVAALLGIWARLFQADKHHKKEYARLGAIQNNIAHLQKKKQSLHSPSANLSHIGYLKQPGQMQFKIDSQEYRSIDRSLSQSQ